MSKPQPPAHKPRIYGYCRASTVKQAESPNVQKEMIAEYVKVRKLGPVDGYFVDTAVSGALSLIQRPAGRELYLRLKPGDTVVFSKLDRAFRKILDCVGVIDDLARKDVSIHFVNANGAPLDLSSSMGRFVCNILAAFAELEREMISERTRESMAYMSSKNLRTTRRAPCGFRWVKVRMKGRDIMMRAPNPDERVVMAKLVELREEAHLSWEKMALAADALGILHPRDGKPWGDRKVNIRQWYMAEAGLRLRELQDAEHARDTGGEPAPA